MAKQEFSIPKLAQMVASEADAYLLLEELRWGGKPTACPHCGGMDRCYFLNPANGASRMTRTGAPSQRRVWKCGHCRKQFSVLTGTICHGSKVPVRTWLLVIFEMCSSKNGVSAREIERKYELTAKTAWFVLHRIREAMKRDPLAGLLSGTVIADETWIGGKDSNRHANKRTNTGVTDKAIVVSLVHYETREVRSRVIADVTATSLLPVIQEEVNMERTALHTDGHKGYRTVAKGWPRMSPSITASASYVSAMGIGTNPAEGFFSQLKRSLDGTHHHVSREHLSRYLGQFDYMYSRCRWTDSERMRDLLRHVEGRRLTYRPLTARQA